jgi:hypothetical protein
MERSLGGPFVTLYSVRRRYTLRSISLIHRCNFYRHIQPWNVVIYPHKYPEQSLYLAVVGVEGW